MRNLIIISLLFISSFSFAVNPYGADSTQATEELIRLGYKCDNSLSDYLKMTSNAAIFGEYHEKLAFYWFAQSDGNKDYFFQKVKQYKIISL